MPEPSSTGVTRHLNYAWVEYGHSGDGQAFSVGLDKLGWKNLVRYLPRKQDSKGPYYVDSAHPLLPIRWKGRCRMILPNAVKDTKSYPKPYIDDPLLNAYRSAHGEEPFRQAIRDLCEFLGRWVFNPGIKGSPTSQGQLTFGTDGADYADIVACSGHGCSGDVWGGDWDLACHLSKALAEHASEPTSDRLKYVLIPTCYNLADVGHRAWIPALRRPKPVHGVFGYSKAYPGGETGRSVFKRFAENLKKDGGRVPIIEAFQRAHTGWLAQRWGALIHHSSMQDTMRDWLAGKLPAPSPTGELRWLCHDTWPDGMVVRTEPAPYTVHYVVGGTKITSQNHQWDDVGLCAGDTGHIEIRKASGSFGATTDLKVIFYYYRPEKGGMDLDKLLTLGATTDAVMTPLTNQNPHDSSAHVDAIGVKPARAGLSKLTAPFTVQATAHEQYPADGRNAYGYFWMKLVVDESTECPHYHDGAWLRGPRS